jgi:hypothetical protein
MNLEHQVCSLDLAKRLKELGVKQESHFVWIEGYDGHAFIRQALDWPEPNPEAISAFSVAELGDLMLPSKRIKHRALIGEQIMAIPTPLSPFRADYWASSLARSCVSVMPFSLA